MHNGVRAISRTPRTARMIAAIALAGAAIVAAPTGPADADPATFVGYTTNASWGTGFQVLVTIRPAVALTGWRLEFDLPDDQRLTNAFCTTSSQTGQHVVLSNLSFNGTIQAGGTVTVGFQVATGSLSNASPSQILLNGQPAQYTPQPTILTSVHTPSVPEGTSTVFTVTLNQPPSSPVRLQVGAGSAAVAASPQSLTFDAGDWNVPHAVTLTSAEDADSVSQLVYIPVQQQWGGAPSYAASVLYATQVDND